MQRNARSGKHRAIVSALPWIAGAAFVASAVAWLSASKRIAKDSFANYSIHNTDDDGLSLAFAYLERIAGRAEAPTTVASLTRPIARANVEPRAVVFRIQPNVDTWLDTLRRAGALRRSHSGKRDKNKDYDGGGDTDTDTDTEPVDANGEDSEENEDEAKDADEDENLAPDLSPANSLLSGEDYAWVLSGGTLVLAIDSDLAGLDVRPLSGEAAVEKVYPIWPSVSQLSPQSPRALHGGPTDRMHAVFASGNDTLVARWLLGAGRIVVLSCPDVFKNSRIAMADHLPLLRALAGAGRPVYFDEYVHGIHTSGGMLELLRTWGLGPLMLLGGLAALMLYWRKAARVGPPEDDHRETRVEAVEFVDSLAELYRRALSNREAIALYFDAFKHEVSIRTGLRGESLEAKVRDLTKGRIYPKAENGRDIGRSTFRHLLRNLNAAFGRLSDVKRF